MHCAVLNSLHHATNVVLYTSAELGSIEKSSQIAYTHVSGVEIIGQCGRLSQLSWLFGTL